MTKTKEAPAQRGGARAGAGRKPSFGKSAGVGVSVVVPQDVVNYFDRVAKEKGISRSAVIAEKLVGIASRASRR